MINTILGPDIPVNGSAPLGSFDGLLNIDGKNYPAEVEASIALLPSPKVVLRAVVEPEEHPFEFFSSAFERKALSLTMITSGDCAPLLSKNWSIGSGSSLTAIIQSGFLTFGTRAPCDEIQFYLLNFPEFIATSADKAYRNWITLRDDEFEIEVEAAEETTESFKKLSSDGGYGVTHVGLVRRQDRLPISFEAAKALMEKLLYFWSFCRGAWCGPLLPAGISGEQLVWRELGNPLIDPWGYSPSWLDRHNAQAARSAFEGFSAAWLNEAKRDLLRRSIYWYLRSNSSAGGVDGSIILTQAALERVAWVELVDECKTLSEDGFERLPAADQIRLLLTTLGIPLALPEGLGELKAIARGFGWDGPGAFTEIRNNLVHPGRRRRRLSNQTIPYFEAWTLGQWYLELVLLHLIGFDDVYGNRTQQSRWAGEVSPVPWHQNA